MSEVGIWRDWNGLEWRKWVFGLTGTSVPAISALRDPDPARFANLKSLPNLYIFLDLALYYVLCANKYRSKASQLSFRG
jgi:hypothetical protein